MTIFIIVLILGCISAVAYVSLMILDFNRVRRLLEVADRQASGGEDALREAAAARQLNERRESIGFAWKALAGVCASVGVLFLGSHVSWAWYLFPLLTLGTATAVCLGFVVDPTRNRNRAGPKRRTEEERTLS